METRVVAEVLKSRPTLEGAGVRLMRGFGSTQLAYIFDPFLLFDDFGSHYPHEYMAGFPWHPHRGIETVTYLLKGEVHHEDSTGTKGVIRSGDLQWMSAGSGIYHAEMPRPAARRHDEEKEDTEMRGFQLWVNIPAEKKMSEPSYRNLLRDNIPSVELDDGTAVKLIAGELRGVPGLGSITGPVKNLPVDAHYLDITMKAGSEINYDVRDGYTSFAYVLDGEAVFDTRKNVRAGPRSVVLYDRSGDRIRIKTDETGARFLLMSGRPLREPIAWYGPIVMNTREQLAEAFQELERGDFIKHRATSYDYIE
ncbi:MAG: pirin family protein [Thermoplasmata archaeon]|uniref:Pirin family protein n=1 Tax=Candidatus Sysuiplasma superficiale TaxID=2823368 RepID=A0A8J7YRB9_9ARCH|nr:pirin family protein [Candidatus Sysuiplasma superficiale]MBX8643147.1 pirin family protein [Candidatus Sysuiplasma superficiale]MCL4346533.1 pirin family protein [Candidatus Thermoplasmatota archaeon]